MPTPLATTPHHPSSTNPTTPLDLQNSMASSLPTAVTSHNDDHGVAPFPHPSPFTFLPDLYNIISRLSILNSTPSNANDDNTIIGSASSIPALLTPSATQSRDDTKSVMNPEGMPVLSGLTKTVSKENQIEVKDLPALIYTVRYKVQEAKEVVKTIQDVDRSVETQDAEIQALERKVKALKIRLGELGGLAGRGLVMDGKDSVMIGVED